MGLKSIAWYANHGFHKNKKIWNLLSMPTHGDEDGLDKHGFCSDTLVEVDDRGSGKDGNIVGDQKYIIIPI